MRSSISTTISAAGLILVATLVAGCSLLAPPTPAPTVIASPTASFPLKAVPGNSVLVPLPTDAPKAVKGLAKLPSCGSEVLFEEDVDISPFPTPPSPTTDTTDNQAALDCIAAAWENGTKAEVDIFEATDEADQILSMYRLPGNGTVVVIVRVLSHTDHTVEWSQRICRQLSIQDATLTPAECASETPIR